MAFKIYCRLESHLAVNTIRVPRYVKVNFLSNLKYFTQVTNRKLWLTPVDVQSVLPRNVVFIGQYVQAGVGKCHNSRPLVQSRWWSSSTTPYIRVRASSAPSITKSGFTFAHETSMIITDNYSYNGRSICMLGAKTRRARKAQSAKLKARRARPKARRARLKARTARPKARRTKPKAGTKSTPTPGDNALSQLLTLTTCNFYDPKQTMLPSPKS